MHLSEIVGIFVRELEGSSRSEFPVHLAFNRLELRQQRSRRKSFDESMVVSLIVGNHRTLP